MEEKRGTHVGRKKRLEINLPLTHIKQKQCYMLILFTVMGISFQNVSTYTVMDIAFHM
jgi:hypothetical protein